MAGEVKIRVQYFHHWPTRRKQIYQKNVLMEIQYPHSIAKHNISVTLRGWSGYHWYTAVTSPSQIRKNAPLEAWCAYAAKSEKTKWYSYTIQPNGQISSSCLRRKPSSTLPPTNAAVLMAHRASHSTVERYKCQCKHLHRTELTWSLLGWPCCQGCCLWRFPLFQSGARKHWLAELPQHIAFFPKYHVVWHMGTVTIPPFGGETMWIWLQGVSGILFLFLVVICR